MLNGLKKSKIGNFKGKQSLIKVPYEEFKQITESYLDDCKSQNKIPFQQELALKLGIAKSTLSEGYSKKPLYAELIKRVSQLTEIGLLQKGLYENKPVFPMFLLKSKFGYIEQQYQKVDLNLSGELCIVEMPPKKPRVVSQGA